MEMWKREKKVRNGEKSEKWKFMGGKFVDRNRYVKVFVVNVSIPNLL